MGYFKLKSNIRSRNIPIAAPSTHQLKNSPLNIYKINTCSPNPYLRISYRKSLYNATKTTYPYTIQNTYFWMFSSSMLSKSPLKQQHLSTCYTGAILNLCKHIILYIKHLYKYRKYILDHLYKICYSRNRYISCFWFYN